MTTSSSNNILNALSFDIEDYFQVSNFESLVSFADWDKYPSRVEANTRKILSLLAESDICATFFILGWVAERFPALVREIVAGGHELAVHGYRHRLIYSLDPKEFREDLRRAIDCIEQAGGQKVLGHRAPSFSITERSLWAIDVMQELGLRYDSSIFPIRHPRYGIPTAPSVPYEIRPDFWEFPLATVKLGPIKLPMAGGAYFRIFPYVLIRWGLRRLNRICVPATVYLHPWEFDPEQPRFNTSLQVRLRHYHNLSQTESRFRRLCGDFRFTAIRDMLK